MHAQGTARLLAAGIVIGLAGLAQAQVQAPRIAADASLQACLCAILQDGPGGVQADLAREQALLAAEDPLLSGSLSLNPWRATDDGAADPSGEIAVRLEFPFEHTWDLTLSSSSATSSGNPSASLRIAQPLYPWPDGALTDAAAEAEAAWRREIEAIVLDGMRLFYDVLHRERLLDIARQELRVAEGELEKMRLQESHGEVSPSQVQAALDGLVQAEDDLLSAEISLASARDALEVLAGGSLPNRLGQDDFVYLEPDPLPDAWSVRALAASATVDDAQAALDEAEADLAEATGLLAGWSVNATGNIGVVGAEGAEPSWSIGVQAVKPLFEQGRVARQAALVEKAARLALDEARRSVAQEAAARYADWEQSERTLALREAQHARSIDQLREVEARFAAGLAVNLDVERARVQADGAAAAVDRARFDRNVALVRLRQFGGLEGWPGLMEACSAD